MDGQGCNPKREEQSFRVNKLPLEFEKRHPNGTNLLQPICNQNDKTMRK